MIDTKKREHFLNKQFSLACRLTPDMRRKMGEARQKAVRRNDLRKLLHYKKGGKNG